MHSTLQSEVRLTQRLVKPSCRHCYHCCESRRRFFHRSRNLRLSQGTRNDAGSQPASPPSENSRDTETKPELASSAPISGYPLPASLSHHFFSQGGDPSEDPDQPPASVFYGSSANRKLRSRALKELPEPAVAAPEWFKDNNVTLWGEGRLVPSIEDANGTSGQPGSVEDHESATGSSSTPSGGPSTPANEILTPAEDTESKSRRAFGATHEERVAKGAPPPTRYYIDASQSEEILHTVRGFIKAPERREFHDEPAIRTTHLLLHYADTKGELLLDEYIRDVACALHSDLVTFDVQDIADLISTSQKGPTITKAGRLLSYDVLKEEEEPPTPEFSEVFSSPGDEDVEEDDDHDAFETPSARSPLGMPVLIGKPITIDLSNIFGGRRSTTKPMGSALPPHFFSDLFQQSSQKSREPLSPFTALIDGLLSVVSTKRIQKAKLSAERPDSSKDDFQERTGYEDCTIIQMKDVKAIQETSIGNQFLRELYGQVEKRRDNGENIMLIGTESAKKNSSDYQDGRIRDLQRAKSDDISRTIVVTPVLPTPKAKADLFYDRRRRTATINLRHIWEMMRLRTKTNFLDLQPGFWKENVYEKLTKNEQVLLSEGVWTFSHVHRICSYISGLEKPPPAYPSALFPERWPEDKIMPLISGVSKLLAVSDKTKVKWADSQFPKPDYPVSFGRPKSSENSRLSDIRASATKHEKRLMSGIIESEKIKTTFEDVHAPAETIDALQTLTTLSLVRPDAFSYGVLASDKIPGLLLYGPPGTGKTLLAKAVAKESGATMLEVSAADINDMFVGEGEKNVKALFSLAKKLSPCVVFLDEADAMFSARSNSGRRVSHRELLNQFLKEWDGMSNDSGSAFIMVATNRPMDLDDAVLRRLPRRLLVDLPTEADRLEILKIHLRNEQLADDVSLPDLAKRTPFYSGSDLKNLAVAAALSAVREEEKLAKNHQGEEPYQYPDKRILTKEHFEQAMEEISASISEDMSSLREIKKFDEQYGDKRGRKRKAPKWGFKSAKEADKVLDTVKVRS